MLGVTGYRNWNRTPQAAFHLPDIDIPGYGSVQVDFLERTDFPAFTIIDDYLAWRNVFRNTELNLGVKNARDEQMVFADQHSFVPGGIVTGGRSISLGLRYRK